MYYKTEESAKESVKPWLNGFASQRKFAKLELAYGLGRKFTPKAVTFTHTQIDDL